MVRVPRTMWDTIVLVQLHPRQVARRRCRFVVIGFSLFQLRGRGAAVTHRRVERGLEEARCSWACSCLWRRCSAGFLGEWRNLGASSSHQKFGPMSHRRSKINGDQNVVNGVVTFRFIEGRVSNIEVSGTEHFNPEYFRSRLARGIEPPFNVNSLGQEQQILLQNPFVRRLNLELLPGLEPGDARLHADVSEASRYRLRKSPTTSPRLLVQYAVN